MAVAACCLEDISNTPYLKTNKWLNKAKRLLHIALEQQAESLASRRRVAPSHPSRVMATANGGALRRTHPANETRQQQIL